MSFQMHGSATRKTAQDIQSVTPTVLIGIGGTGKEVLLKLRQLFYEKHSVTGLPIMRYLWIDTDVGDLNIDGKPLDYISDEVKFKEFEKVDCRISQGAFTAILKNKNQNHHIFRWFDGRLARLGSVMNGARQIRQLGRLAFFHHSHSNNDIRHQIGMAVEAVKSLDNHNQLRQEYGIDCEKNIRFILVFSVAGGTGSGMFLDTAFMIRKEFEKENPDIISYLVLPGLFSPDPHDARPLYANAYAALKELEYYSMRKDFFLAKEAVHAGTSAPDAREDHSVSAHDFECLWKGFDSKLQVPDDLKISGPPFNTCYIIDNQTEGGGRIGPELKTDLCDMLAENIFIDYSKQGFATKKRSVRSNLDDYLTREVEFKYRDQNNKEIHSEIFSCRFSTFGLNKMYIPTERIRKACSYRLLYDMMALAVKQNPPEADPELTVKREYLSTLLMRVERNFDDFVDGLKSAEDDKTTFSQIIERQWLSNERAALLSLANNKNTRDLAGEIERRLFAFRKANLDMPRNPDDWGGYIKRVKVYNKKRFIDNRQERLQKLVNSWIDAPHIRIQLAETYLMALNRILANDANFYAQTASTFRKRENGYLERIKGLLAIMKDEESGVWHHGWSIKTIVERITQTISDYFKNSIMIIIFDTSVELCQEMQHFIGAVERKEIDGHVQVLRRGLIQTIWRLQEYFIEMQSGFNDKFKSFVKTPDHSIFINLYDSESWEDYYFLYSPDKTKTKLTAEALCRLEPQLRNHVNLSSYYDLLAEIERLGIGNVMLQMESYAMTRFKDIQFDDEAVLKLYKLYPIKSTELQQKLDHFVRYGKVWCRKDALASANQEVGANYAEEIELGCSQHNLHHQYYQDFDQRVRNIVQGIGFRGVFPATVDVAKDTVYIYDEYAGIPLMYIGGLKSYQEAYYAEALNGRTLHIDKIDDRFTDVIIKSEEEVRGVISATKLLLAGSILRALRLIADEEGIENYIFQDIDAINPTARPLGSGKIAVEMLCKDRDLYDDLANAIERIQSRLSPDLRKKYYCILHYHYTGVHEAAGIPAGPFPILWIKRGNQHIQKLSTEHRALLDLTKQQSNELKALLSWEEIDLNNHFISFYHQLDQCSDTVKVRGKAMRIFKETELGDLVRKL